MTIRPNIVRCLFVLASFGISALGSSELEGRWRLNARMAPDHTVNLWINLSGEGDTLKMIMDLTDVEARILGFNGPMAELPLGDVALKGTTLHWSIPLPGKPADCHAERSADGHFQGHCRMNDQQVPIRLERAGSVAETIQIEASNDEERRHVEAVHRVVHVVGTRDYEGFESLFATRMKGMEPDQLWQGAFVVLMKFGQVKKLAFSELDGDGAFVRVHFERAQRELYVRLDDENKIRELSYVPPLDARVQP